MYGPTKKGMRLWAHFLPRLVQGFSRASLETRWKMSPSSFAAITGRAKGKTMRLARIDGGILPDAEANAAQGPFVTFLPVVGEKYALQGKRTLGRRVMVVGASHYCEHFEHVVGCNALCAHFGKYYFAYKGGELFFGKRCERFSHVVLERYRKQIGEPDERRWFRTFSRFYNAFFPAPVSHETRIALMDSMISTEYVQGAEARGPNGNNREAMGSDRNFKVFRNTISELKPEVIIFWGPRAWHEVCKRLDGVDEKADILYVTLDKRQLTLVRVPHPASSKFNHNHFQMQLKSVGICADKLVNLRQHKRRLK